MYYINYWEVLTTFLPFSLSDYIISNYLDIVKYFFKKSCIFPKVFVKIFKIDPATKLSDRSFSQKK